MTEQPPSAPQPDWQKLGEEIAERFPKAFAEMAKTEQPSAEALLSVYRAALAYRDAMIVGMEVGQAHDMLLFAIEAAAPTNAAPQQAAPECEHHWIGGNDGLWCTKCKVERPAPDDGPDEHGFVPVTEEALAASRAEIDALMDPIFGPVPERPAPEGPQLSSEAWAYLAGLGGYGPTDVEEAARLYPQAGATDERTALQLAEAKVAQLSETAGEDYSVGYESGTKAILARLGEPDVREAVIDALMTTGGWVSSFEGDLRLAAAALTDAAIAKIEEMLK